MGGQTFSLRSRNVSLILLRTVLAALLVLAVLVESARFSPAAAQALPEIVFATRTFNTFPAAKNRPGAIERAQSGRLLLRETNGGFRPLFDASTPGAPIDVADPDVSFDGKKVVFAGLSASENAWRIYEVEIASGYLRQITRTDRTLDDSRYGDLSARFAGYDDVDPCYAGDGLVCFVSTRYPGVAPDERHRATNLYVVETAPGAGGAAEPRRITSERFGADSPTVDPTTGKIVYSRWWMTPPDPDRNPDPQDPALPEKPPPTTPPGSPGYGGNGNGDPADPNNPLNPPAINSKIIDGVEEADFPGVNNWFLASINPDGTGMEMLTGTGLDRRQTQAYRPSFFKDGKVLALFLPTTPFLGVPGKFGLRQMERGAAAPVPLGGPQNFLASTTTVDAAGNVGMPVPPPANAQFLYAHAAALPDGRILVSGISASNRNPVDYDIFIQDGRNPAVPLFGTPGTAELDPVPVIIREVKPNRPDPAARVLDNDAPRNLEEAIREGGKFTFLCENIFANPALDSPLPGSPPVGKKLFIEFFMNPQRTDPFAADEPILIHRQEIKADGRVEAELPAGVPLFEVLRRSDERIARGRDGQIFHVGGNNFGTAESEGRCVGCHSGHSMIPVPEEPAWTNLASSSVITDETFRNQQQVNQGSRFIFPQLLVDRSTRSNSVWVAAMNDPEPTLVMRWSVPIRARKAVFHGVKQEPNLGRTLVLNGLSFTISLEDQLLQSKTVGVISDKGTAVDLDPSQEFDTIRVSMRARDANGTIEKGLGAIPALAEIEIIGRAVEGHAPSALAVRGDADCSGFVNLTDSVRLLGALFLGEGPLCCAAAADVNHDGALDITDPIHLLVWLFVGGEPPPAPHPFCGRISEDLFPCDQDTCR